MNQVVTHVIQLPREPGKNPVVKVMTAKSAEFLANHYLPIHLRDFYLTCHPMVQAWLFLRSNSPEMFFTNVMEENARFERMNRNPDQFQGRWASTVVVDEMELEYNSIQRINNDSAGA